MIEQQSGSKKMSFYKKNIVMAKAAPFTQGSFCRNFKYIYTYRIINSISCVFCLTRCDLLLNWMFLFLLSGVVWVFVFVHVDRQIDRQTDRQHVHKLAERLEAAIAQILGTSESACEHVLRALENTGNIIPVSHGKCALECGVVGDGEDGDD